MGRLSGGAPWTTKIVVGPADSCERSRALSQMRGSRAAPCGVPVGMHTAFTERGLPRYGAGRHRKHKSRNRDESGAPGKQTWNISKRRWLRR
jgi:hypothetical protein